MWLCHTGHGSEDTSASRSGVTVSWGNGPSTEWPSRPRFDRPRPYVLPGMLPEDSTVGGQDGPGLKLTGRSQGSGSGEVYWWSRLDMRPGSPETSGNAGLEDEDAACRPSSQSETEAAIQ